MAAATVPPTHLTTHRHSHASGLTANTVVRGGSIGGAGSGRFLHAPVVHHGANQDDSRGSPKFPRTPNLATAISPGAGSSSAPIGTAAAAGVGLDAPGAKVRQALYLCRNEGTTLD